MPRPWSTIADGPSPTTVTPSSGVDEVDSGSLAPLRPRACSFVSFSDRLVVPHGVVGLALLRARPACRNRFAEPLRLEPEERSTPASRVPDLALRPPASVEIGLGSMHLALAAQGAGEHGEIGAGTRVGLRGRRHQELQRAAVARPSSMSASCGWSCPWSIRGPSTLDRRTPRMTGICARWTVRRLHAAAWSSNMSSQTRGSRPYGILAHSLVALISGRGRCLGCLNTSSCRSPCSATCRIPGRWVRERLVLGS